MSKSSFLTDLQTSFDWQTYIESNFEYKKSGNGEYRLDCISCGNNKKKLYVNPDKCFFNCFACDFHTGKYDLFDFICKTEGITRNQAILRLSREYAPVMPDRIEDTILNKIQEKKFTSSGTPVIKGIASMPAESKLFRKPAEGFFWEYLLNRGLTVEEVIVYGFRYVPDEECLVFDSNGKRRGNIGRRILIPVYGGDHKLVSWQARVTDPDYKFGDKYLACPESDLAKTVWPYSPPYEKSIVIQEGILDTLATRRCGKPVSSYAVFSKHISSYQISLFKLWNVEEVTVFFDIRDAKKEIIRTVETLKMHFNKVNVLDTEGWTRDQDAGDCLKKSDGTKILSELLTKKIDVYSLAYDKWKLLG